MLVGTDIVQRDAGAVADDDGHVDHALFSQAEVGKRAASRRVSAANPDLLCSQEDTLLVGHGDHGSDPITRVTDGDLEPMTGGTRVDQHQ